MIQPIHLNILIRPMTSGISPGGILLTESTNGFQRGTIVEMGNGEHRVGCGCISAFDEEVDVTEGDEVYFTGGASITDPDTGETFLLVHYNSIVARIYRDEPDEAEEPADVPSFGGYTDWIPWSGGECPVEGEVEVMVVLRYELDGGGNFGESSYGGNWFWTHSYSDSDIVYYRVV